MIETFVVTGTGRCGTMPMQRLLNAGERAVCEHEACFHHQSMLDYYERRDSSGFARDIAEGLEKRRKECAEHGKLYGVCSGHAYFAIPQLWERYGERARYVLLVRRPDEFARSAIARGFFDPGHPNYCAQIAPHSSDAIAEPWNDVSVLERNLWYWRLVNSFVLDEFDKLPPHVCRVVFSEDISHNNLDHRVAAGLELCRFVGLSDISDAAARMALEKNINSTPGEPGEGDHNPFSIEKKFPKRADWTPEQVRLLRNYADVLADRLYGPDRQPL